MMAALTSWADVGGTDAVSIYKMRGNACRGERTVNGFEVMGEGVGDDVRITESLTITFQMHYAIIFPFKVRNIFPKILRFSVKTSIN
jgi:hypothetical protein